MDISNPDVREPRCAGGSSGYCLTEESAQYPKYIDDDGIKKCYVCHGRGPRYDNEEASISLANFLTEIRKKNLARATDDGL